MTTEYENKRTIFSEFKQRTIISNFESVIIVSTSRINNAKTQNFFIKITGTLNIFL